jgi:hypothetical protein
MSCDPKPDKLTYRKDWAPSFVFQPSRPFKTTRALTREYGKISMSDPGNFELVMSNGMTNGEYAMMFINEQLQKRRKATTKTSERFYRLGLNR